MFQFIKLFQVHINGEPVKVCQKFFIAVYKFSQKRLTTISIKIQTNEKRGADKRFSKYNEKFNEVKKNQQVNGKEATMEGKKSTKIKISEL